MDTHGHTVTQTHQSKTTTHNLYLGSSFTDFVVLSDPVPLRPFFLTFVLVSVPGVLRSGPSNGIMEKGKKDTVHGHPMSGPGITQFRTNTEDSWKFVLKRERTLTRRNT